MKNYYVIGGVIVISTLFVVHEYAQRNTIDKQKETLLQQSTKITSLTEQLEKKQTIQNNVVIHTITTVKRPDGTTIVTNRTSEDKTKVREEETDKIVNNTVQTEAIAKTKEKESVVNVEQSKYSLFATYPTTTDKDITQVHIGAAVRLGGTPLWLQGEAGLTGEMRVGLRVDF